MELAVCVAKLEAETGGAVNRGSLPSMRKVFNWELKVEILPVKQVMEEQSLKQLECHLEEKAQLANLRRGRRNGSI